MLSALIRIIRKGPVPDRWYRFLQQPLLVLSLRSLVQNTLWMLVKLPQFNDFMHSKSATTVFLSRVVQEELEEQQLWHELDKQTNCKPITLGKKLQNQDAQSRYKSITKKHIHWPDAAVFFDFMASIRNMNKQRGILFQLVEATRSSVARRTRVLSFTCFVSHLLKS